MAYINFFNSTPQTTTEVFRISSNGNVGIGTVSPRGKLELNEYNEFVDILELSKTHPAVKAALDKLRATYYLSKDNGNKG